jgi:DnaK suppressor protein
MLPSMLMVRDLLHAGPAIAQPAAKERTKPMLAPEQISQFRARLDAERDDILARIADLEEGIVTGNTEADTNAGVDNHMADVGTELFMQEQSAGMIESLRARLAQVERALTRMDEGSYGLSEVSGEPIPVERLDALPWATTLTGEELP